MRDIEKHSLGRKRKVYIVFDDMIVDIISNKKLNPIITEHFIRGRQLNIYIAFIHNSISKYQKKLDSVMHTFIMKIPNKTELQKLH